MVDRLNMSSAEEISEGSGLFQYLAADSATRTAHAGAALYPHTVR
jgi:hypothetical protein